MVKLLQQQQLLSLSFSLSFFSCGANSNCSRSAVFSSSSSFPWAKSYQWQANNCPQNEPWPMSSLSLSLSLFLFSLAFICHPTTTEYKLGAVTVEERNSLQAITICVSSCVPCSLFLVYVLLYVSDKRKLILCHSLLCTNCRYSKTRLPIHPRLLLFAPKTRQDTHRRERTHTGIGMSQVSIFHCILLAFSLSSPSSS